MLLSSVNSQCSISEGTKGTEGNVPLLSIFVFGIVAACNRQIQRAGLAPSS